jgi:hypothetical protein
VGVVRRRILALLAVKLIETTQMVLKKVRIVSLEISKDIRTRQMHLCGGVKRAKRTTDAVLSEPIQRLKPVPCGCVEGVRRDIGVVDTPRSFKWVGWVCFRCGWDPVRGRSGSGCLEE